MNHTRRPWNNWIHCMGSTYGAWIRGDSRGWRARHHREHVDGDYKYPPPPGTYDRLHNYCKFIMKRDAVILDLPQRRTACIRMAEVFAFHEVQVIELCVSPMHFHALVRFVPMPEVPTPVKKNPLATKNRQPRHIVGIAKKESARALSKMGLLPKGGVWAVRCKCKPIRKRHHQVRVARYIRAHFKRGAVVLSLIRISTRKPRDCNPWA